MARILKSPFYDGYTFTRGRFNCKFRQIPESNSWIIEVVIDHTGAAVFDTVPLPTKTEAYCLAMDWLDHLQTCPLLVSVLGRQRRAFKAESAVLRAVAD